MLQHQERYSHFQHIKDCKNQQLSNSNSLKRKMQCRPEDQRNHKIQKGQKILSGVSEAPKMLKYLKAAAYNRVWPLKELM